MKLFKKINIWHVFICILLFHLFLLTKIKFTAWPEMLLWPYLMLNGFSVYKDIAIAHTPLMLIELIIFFKVLGIGIIQLKMFTWILIGVTDFLVFLVAKKLYGSKTAVISTLVFFVLQTYFDGNGLWFDLALSPLALIVFYLVREKKYFGVGMVTSLMFITKQTAFWFFIPLLAEIFFVKKDIRINLSNFVKGACIVFSGFLLGVGILGLLDDFWFWAINYGIFTLPFSQGQMQPPGLRSLAVSLFPFSVLLLYFFKKVREPKYITLWIVAGVLGAYSRFELFHFQPALPFLALAIGNSFSKLKIPNNFLLKAFLILYLLGFAYLFSSFFIRNYNEGTRFYENDVQKVADYIKNNSAPKDKIFVVNWWDHIYALSGTLPATLPWVPQLKWYQEIPGIEEKEVYDLSVNRPRIIVYQDRSDFGLASYIPEKVFEFVMSNYIVKERIGSINILVLK